MLMVAMGVLLAAGLAVAAWCVRARYREWPSDGGEVERTPRLVALRYLRGVAVGIVAGFWTGLLITGPAIRLIMRLLGAMAGDGAQGALTEAGEVVGEIDVGGTLGLIGFGGVLPGMLSGAIYVLIRRLLPAGWAGGAVFGLLHLVVAATRIDPLRADNVDFDVLGNGLIAVLTFGLACVVHGVAIAAIAGRFSNAFPSRRVVVWLPVVPAALLLLPGVFLLVPIMIGLLLAFAVSYAPADRRRVVLAGRIVLAVIVLISLPGAVLDLIDIAGRG